MISVVSSELARWSYRSQNVLDDHKFVHGLRSTRQRHRRRTRDAVVGRLSQVAASNMRRLGATSSRITANTFAHGGKNEADAHEDVQGEVGRSVG